MNRRRSAGERGELGFERAGIGNRSEAAVAHAHVRAWIAGRGIAERGEPVAVERRVEDLDHPPGLVARPRGVGERAEPLVGGGPHEVDLDGLGADARDGQRPAGAHEPMAFGLGGERGQDSRRALPPPVSAAEGRQVRQRARERRVLGQRPDGIR